MQEHTLSLHKEHLKLSAWETGFMNTLQVALPESDLNFLQQYASQQGLTLSQLVGRWAKQLQTRQNRQLHPSLEAISGILPSEMDVTDEYHHAQLRKHQWR